MVLILRLIAYVNLYTLWADICSSVIVTALKAKATCICYLKCLRYDPHIPVNEKYQPWFDLRKFVTSRTFTSIVNVKYFQQKKTNVTLVNFVFLIFFIAGCCLFYFIEYCFWSYFCRKVNAVGDEKNDQIFQFIFRTKLF